MALTGKKRIFADAVLAGSSNKEAAIAAGYSAATASPAGSRLAKDTSIVAHIAKHRHGAPATQQPEAASQPERKPFDLGAVLMHTDPKAFLIAAMNDGGLENKLRVDAAKALMPFIHQKLGESGKKDLLEDAAKKVASRFAAGVPPKLATAGGKKV